MNVPACRHRWPRNDRSGRGPEAASSQRSDTATLGTLPRLARCFLLNGWTSIRVFIAMASTLVTRDQFNVTPQGVVHKPTEAGFIPHSGDPHSVEPASQRRTVPDGARSKDDAGTVDRVRCQEFGGKEMSGMANRNVGISSTRRPLKNG